MISLTAMSRAVLAVTVILSVLLPLADHVTAQTCGPVTADLVSWWRGEGNAEDFQGGNHGTLHNGVAFSTGVVGQSFSLDGVDDYVDFGEPLSLNFVLTADFTISGWILGPVVASPRGVIIARGDDFSAQQNRFISVDVSTNKLRAFVRGDTGEGNTLQVVSNTILPSASFVHFAFVRRKGVQGELYINGILDATGAPDNAGSITFTASRPLTVGSANVGAIGGPNSFFGGRIDEVKIFNRALVPAEIQCICDAVTPGACASTAVAYSCVGFDSPFDSAILLKRNANRSIPLKMQLFNDGVPVTDANIAGQVPVVNITHSAGPARQQT